MSLFPLFMLCDAHVCSQRRANKNKNNNVKLIKNSKQMRKNACRESEGKQMIFYECTGWCVWMARVRILRVFHFTWEFYVFWEFSVVYIFNSKGTLSVGWGKIVAHFMISKFNLNAQLVWTLLFCPKLLSSLW